MIFFIISAFVCMISLEKNDCVSDFYKKRAINILPLYYFVILIHFIIYRLILNQVPTDNTGVYWARYIFFLSAQIPSESVFWVNLGATWTVGSFLVFYLIAPFIHKKIHGIWQAAFLCGFTYLYGAIFNLMGYNLEINGFYNLRFFSIGVLLYQIYKYGKVKEAIPILAALLGILLIKNGNGYSVKYEYAILFAIIMLSTMEWKINKASILARIINVLDFYSFTIYLVHPIFTNWVKEINFQIYISNYYIWRITCIAFVIAGTMMGTILVQIVVDKIRNTMRSILFVPNGKSL